MSTTTRSGHPARLPAESDSSARRMQVLEGLAALVGGVLLVVGVPLGLVAAFGAPWPEQMPSIDVLSRPTDADTLLGVLAVVVWLAWLHFVVCLAVEAVAEIRHRGLAPRVPGGGIGTQYLARKVVVAIALLIGTSVATIGPVAAANAAAPTSPAASSSRVVGVEQAATATGAAGTTAPTTTATREAASAALPRLGDLKEATPHDVARGVTTYYRVQPPKGRHYDTMWDIAERYLGSGIRYKEIWELNKGLDQGDGRTLSNADLIQPNWVLRLPNDAKGPGLKVVAHAAPAAPTAPQPLETSVGGSVSDGAGTATSGTAAPSTREAAPDTGPSVVARVLDGRWAPLFGVAGGLAVSGAWIGLRRRRSSFTVPQLWAVRGAGGPDPRDPGPDGGPQGGGSPGERLRGESDPSTAAWVDASLRSWRPASGAAPSRVSIGSSGMAMTFDDGAAGDPPAGWSAEGEHTWVVAREQVPAAGGPAPLPGLVCVGRRSDDTLLLIDPESTAGIVAIDGADPVARGLAMSMAVDTATHAWADDRRVTLVGFADDLTGIGPALRRSDDLGRALEAIENTARYQRQGCRTAGVASIREARLTAPEAQDWTYQLLVCSARPGDEELARLRALAADPAVSLGVVVVGAVAADAGDMVLQAHADGRLTAPMHGIDVRAQVLDVRATRALSDLYEPPAGARPVSLAEVAQTLTAEGTRDVVAEASVHIGLLGPISITAPGPVTPARRPFLTELAAFLAVHPDGVHANRLTAALWPRGVDDAIRDSALRQLGEWLGSTGDARPILLEEAGVYSLAPGAVEVDWDGFRRQLNAAGDSPAGRDSALRSALALVRGRPFADTPAGRYAWLEGLGVEGDMALAVSLTALALAESAGRRRDLPAARSFLARGLAMLPASEELWRSRLRLEADLGSPDELRAAVGEMYAAIAAHGSPVGASAQTDSLVDELVPGYRDRVA